MLRASVRQKQCLILPILYIFFYFFEDFSFKYLYFLFRKLRQHPIRDFILLMSSDPDLDPSEFISSEFRYDITQSILSAVASLFSLPHFSKLHIDIIGDYRDIYRWIELIEMHETRDRIS